MIQRFYFCTTLTLPYYEVNVFLIVDNRNVAGSGKLSSFGVKGTRKGHVPEENILCEK